MNKKEMKINDVCFSVQIGNRFFQRLRGLIGRKIDEREGFLLTPCNGVHTWFMSYPIDVLYLSRDFHVLHCDRQVSPGRMLKPVHGAKQVLELRGGTIKPGEKIVVEVC